jgi:hypothetical protein
VSLCSCAPLGSTGEGLEISLNTSQRMGVVNLVITYKIDGGNLIDFILHFYTVNAIVIAQKFNNKITNLLYII